MFFKNKRIGDNPMDTISIGNQIISQLETSDTELLILRSKLQNFNLQKSEDEELYSWFVCVVALSAAINGNFGVGAALVDLDKGLIDFAENSVFTPFFRSDGHAEMLLLNKLENKRDIGLNSERLIIYTSLESCPMCLTRIITSKIITTIHVANDDIGGMARKRDLLPGVWQDLQNTKCFRKANCSPELSEIALQIFLSNADQLNKKIC